MLRLAIGDNLLIMQTSTVPALPWRYRLIDLIGNTIVASESGITDDYKIVTLTAAYAAYEGKTLLLEILDNAGALIEDDLLLISGPYGKLESMTFLAGLLGENAKHESALSTDFQDGHEKHKTITLYNEAALSTELNSYDYNHEYVADFTPDARYQTQEITQEET